MSRVLNARMVFQSLSKLHSKEMTTHQASKYRLLQISSTCKERPVDSSNEMSANCQSASSLGSTVEDALIAWQLKIDEMLLNEPQLRVHRKHLQAVRVN